MKQSTSIAQPFKNHSRREIKEESIKMAKLFKQMKPFFLKQKGLLIFVLFCVLIYSLLGRVAPLLLGFAVDHGIHKKNLKVIYTITGFYFFSELLRAIFSFLQFYLIRKLGHRILFDIRSRLIAHIQRLKISYFDRVPVGKINTRVTNDVVSFGNLLNEGFTVILLNCLELLTILAALIYISLVLSSVTLFFVVLICLFTAVLSQKLRVYYRKAKKDLASINAYSSESIRGIKVLQLYHLAGYAKRKFSSFARNYKKSRLKSARLSAVLWPSIPFLNGVLLIFVLALGSFLHMRFKFLSLGDLIAFIILLRSFNAPLRIILERYSEYQDGLSSADRIFSLLNEKTEADTQCLISKGILQSGRESHQWKNLFKKDIKIRNLNFCYHKGSPLVLKNIHLDLKVGKNVALIGKTGSGKTTLVSLLQRFYDSPVGDIFVGSHQLNEIPCDVLRSQISVIQQDHYIFKGTVFSNIRLNQYGVSREEIERIIEKENLSFLSEGKTLNLDLKVEAGGVNLSSGEKQLLSLTRALIFPPDFLILDEATADIDSECEGLIQKAITKVLRNKTSLIIAHRLSTIKNCDQIVVLDKGEIVEMGTHAELMNKKKKYYEFHQKN